MEFKLSDLKIAQSTFLDKILNDLHFGVKVKSPIAPDDAEDIVIRVWTDNRFWQFSLTGISADVRNIVLQRIEIQSFGQSKKYIKLNGAYLNQEIKLTIDKLGTQFAQLATVTLDEAREFIDGYMGSSINRTLTEQLFAEYVKNQNLSDWIIK
ncbi:MAG TPA: hypothetical protein VJC17_03075 [Candidatus Dojkabacteria bacterium]|nr:hypothetical protein [Candidatus Dojkabacteria bacterium]